MLAKISARGYHDIAGAVSVGSAHTQCVRKVVDIRHHDYLLGIVPCMSLRGRQGRQLLRARVVCNRYATQYRSVSFPGMSLRGCEAAVAIRSP